VLFRSRAAANLSDKEKELLLSEIKNTLQEAIHYKGSSIDQYVQLSGEPGDYVSHHKVYDKEGKPCVRCNAPIKRIALGGRGTYFCPKCQK
jgi:formamidopyrimidine-DNA glycosylase